MHRSSSQERSRNQLAESSLAEAVLIFLRVTAGPLRLAQKKLIY